MNMFTIKKILSGISVLGILFLMSGSSLLFAWTQWTAPYDDSMLPIPLYAQKDGTTQCAGTTEFGSYQRAGLEWNRPTTSKFEWKAGGVVVEGEKKDGKFNISFAGGFQPGVLAYTAIKSYGPFGEKDVVVNQDISWYCGTGSPGAKTDLQTVVLHELGHGLGLGHSDKFLAVMYAFYQGVRRTLNTDDINGLSTMYPQ
jgi:hypothetical protein